MSHPESTPRIGVIGVGTIGQTHINTWTAIGVPPVAFADAVPAALETTVEKSGGRGFASGLDLIASGEVDIVSVCTPPAFHRDIVVAALEANVAVLCEKPLAHNLADAEAIAEVAGRTGTLFTVGFCHRFQPHLQRIRQLIDDGELGTVMSYRNRFAGHKKDAEKTWFANPAIAGGGVLSDTSIHSIDTFRYLLGDPVRVHAFTSTRETELGPRLEVDDTAAMILQTAEGTIGVIESSWRTPAGEWSFAVHGTAGTALFDYATMKLQVIDASKQIHDIEVEEGDRFQREFAHFLDCWRTGATPRVTVADGLAANRILDAAYRTDQESAI
jgi:predicted dehydrogenase